MSRQILLSTLSMMAFASVLVLCLPSPTDATNITVTAKSFYSSTGLQIPNGTVRMTILETGDSASMSITGPPWSLPIYPATNLNDTTFTLGISVNDTTGRSGYFVAKSFGQLSLPPQTTCSSQKWRLAGTAVDPGVGSLSSSGTVRVDVEGTQTTNSTPFTNGAWEIFLEPCLVSGGVYTFYVSLSDTAGKNGLIVLRQVAK